MPFDFAETGFLTMGKISNGMEVGPIKGKSRPEAFRVDWLETKRLDHRTLEAFQGELKELTDGEKAKLRHEIETRGFTEPITAWRKGKRLKVLNGHQRLAVLEEMDAQGLRIPKIPVNIIKAKNEKEAKLKLLALTSQYGKMTPTGLQEFIKEAGLQDNLDELLDSFRFPELNLKRVIHDLDKAASEPGEDVGGADAPAIVQPGDLIEMGVHRLVCGDSRDPDVLDKLMGKRKVDMVLIDPPYGIDYVQKTDDLTRALTGGARKSKHKHIENDKDRDYRSWFGAYYAAVKPFLAKNNTVYTFMAGQELHNLRLAFEDAGYKWGDYLIWVKNSAVLSRKDYNARHEFIMYGWYGRHKFYGGTAQTTVLEHPKPQRNDLHPTMKPVELCADLILHGTKRGGVLLDGDAGAGAARFDATLSKEEEALIVQDGFLGSGSTLIACQQTGRACYGCELDAHYCDVIIDRWTSYTGTIKVKINGKVTKWPNA
jgi:site-specific DNA-methyltransferase (adenine-specific)